MENTRSGRSLLMRIVIPLTIWLIPVFAVALTARRWLPSLASEHGASIDRMIYYLLYTVGFLFVLGHALLGYFIWRFSRREDVTYRLPTARAERRWSIAPVIVMALVAEGGVLILGLPVWGKLYASAAPSSAVTIEVTAEQFAWNVRYGGADGAFGRSEPSLLSMENVLGIDKTDPAAKDDIVGLGRIVVAVNRPVRIRLRSKDTLHSFYLPNLRVKQDAVPGMTIEFWFVPTAEGNYELACAELCGLFHYQMRAIFDVVSEEEFQKWLGQQQTFF